MEELDTRGIAEVPICVHVSDIVYILVSSEPKNSAG